MPNEVSTQESCNWLVQVGKKELTLSQAQYEALVEADKRGNIKMVHFRDFSINLGYVSYMEKVKKNETYNPMLDPYSSYYDSMSIDDAEKKVKRLLGENDVL